MFPSRLVSARQARNTSLSTLPVPFALVLLQMQIMYYTYNCFRPTNERVRCAYVMLCYSAAAAGTINL